MVCIRVKLIRFLNNLCTQYHWLEIELIFLVCWYASADSCFFLFRCIFFLAFFVLAYLHMIDQTKISISGHVWAGVGGCARVCECVWDEFSEFLPENRVPTSADFNTYPIRIFHFSPMCCSQMMSCSLLSRSYCIMRTAVGPTTYCLSTVFNFGNFSSSL